MRCIYDVLLCHWWKDPDDKEILFQALFFVPQICERGDPYDEPSAPLRPLGFFPSVHHQRKLHIEYGGNLWLLDQFMSLLYVSHKHRESLDSIKRRFAHDEGFKRQSIQDIQHQSDEHIRSVLKLGKSELLAVAEFTIWLALLMDDRARSVLLRCNNFTSECELGTVPPSKQMSIMQKGHKELIDLVNGTICFDDFRNRMRGIYSVGDPGMAKKEKEGENKDSYPSSLPLASPSEQNFQQHINEIRIVLNMPPDKTENADLGNNGNLQKAYDEESSESSEKSFGEEPMEDPFVV